MKIQSLAFFVIFALSPVAAVAQQLPIPQPAAGFVQPKTPWGDPDLQGFWPGVEMVGVPLQRPARYGTRNVLTEEEFAKRASEIKNEEESLLAEIDVFTADVTTPCVIRCPTSPTPHWQETGKPSRQASLIVDPIDGRQPPLSAEGQARQAQQQADAKARSTRLQGREADTYLDRSLYDRCITRGVGGVFPVLYGNGLRIVQTPDAVVISYEMVHDTRVIPLDGRANVGRAIKQYMGSARGHFEGDTLVVETTNFTDRIGFQGPNSEGLKLTERFTRIDPQMIDYRIRVEDPAMYTAPFTMRFTITAQPNYQMYEYSCHEGNSAVGNALSGERAYERLVAEAKAKGQPIPPRTMGMEVYSGAPVQGVQPVRELGGAGK